jgi:hypothetical protein
VSSLLGESTERFFASFRSILKDEYNLENVYHGDPYLVRYGELDPDSALFLITLGKSIYLVTTSDQISEVPTDKKLLSSWIGTVAEDDIIVRAHPENEFGFGFNDDIGYYNIYELPAEADYHDWLDYYHG